MSRVWIYQANRFLNEHEAVEIKALARQFVSSWTAHGAALAGKANILHNLFLILEVDEEVAGVTGCSIDKSVHFIKSLCEQFNVDFFDRMSVAFLDKNDDVKLVSREDFQKLVDSKQVTADTIVFNNLVQSTEELDSKWKNPFSESWHSKVF